MMGPSVLLLPLKFFDVGIGTSAILIFIIGLISYRTCDLCHLHTKLTEFEYLTAIERILGKGAMTFYFINSVIILIMAGIIYFLTLSDTTYSAICYGFSINCPHPEDTNWG